MGFYRGLDGSHTAPQEGAMQGYAGLPIGDKGSSHEYGANTQTHEVYEETKGCAEHLSELGNGNLCGPQPGRVLSQMNGEGHHNLPQNLSEGCEQSKEFTTAASCVSNEHLPANGQLHHVRYEIGEHPLADFVKLTGGGGVAAPVLVGTLVPGSKAEQAGVSAGDELVAVSGRPDFQRMPADRLLESLPTPTLLVFSKDTQQPGSEDSQRIAGAEAARRENVALGAATSPNNSNGDRGFAGASWEVGVNGEPATTSMASSDTAQSQSWRQTISSRKWAGLSRYSTEPTQPSQEARPEAPKPSQLALIREDIIAGLPSDHSFIGPNVHVCDQVVFNPKAALWMQGVQLPEREQSAPSSPNSAYVGDEDDPGITHWKRHTSKGKAEDGSTFMYELPALEARRLVNSARRAAARADRTSSRESSTFDYQYMIGMESTGNTIIDLDTLAEDHEKAEAEAAFLLEARDAATRGGMVASSQKSAQPPRPGPDPADMPDLERMHSAEVRLGENGSVLEAGRIVYREPSDIEKDARARNRPSSKRSCSNGPRLGPKASKAPERVNPDVDEFVDPEEEPHDRNEAVEHMLKPAHTQGRRESEVLM